MIAGLLRKYAGIASLVMTAIAVMATPTKDECTQASGCISLAGGGTASFNLSAMFDIDTLTQNGQLRYTDSTLAQGGLTLNSTMVIDYTVVDAKTRAFSFDLTGTAYSQARITVTDNGDTGDTIQVQLLDGAGAPIYDTLAQTLNATCPGQITIGDCVVPSPCQLEVSAMCAMPQAPPTANDCEGKVTRMVMQYTRDDCSKMVHNQAPGKVSCSGVTGPLPAQVYIKVTDAFTPNASKANTFFKGTVQAGQNYTIDATANGGRELRANTYIYIYDREGGQLLQSVGVHTSCSQPLAAGNQFGANLLVSLTSTQGGTDTMSNQPAATDCTITGESGQIDFVYIIKNTGGTAVPLSSLSVTDSFGPLDLSQLGNGSIAPGGSVTLTVTETVTGPFPFVNTVTASGGTDQCSDSATVTVQQKNPPPEAECDDFVTGGGWILGTPSGAKGNFGVHGGLKKGKLWGGLNYLDHGSGLHVKSTGVTGYSVTSATCRHIVYNVTIDGKPGTASVDVCDNGEPGRDDTFRIQLSDGYVAEGDLGGSRHGGGNIQLHKKKCKDDKDSGGGGGVADCTTDGKPNKLTLTYTGGSCASAQNSQPVGRKYNCTESNGGLSAGPARIIVSSSSTAPTATSQRFYDAEVANGASFNVSGEFGANTYFFIYQGGSLKQTVQMHTSCSAPLIRGETFGGIKLTDYFKIETANLKSKKGK